MNYLDKRIISQCIELLLFRGAVNNTCIKSYSTTLSMG
nr:MAG TPA: hypothetical protein [Caudoviricetes sp.]